MARHYPETKFNTREKPGKNRGGTVPVCSEPENGTAMKIATLLASVAIAGFLSTGAFAASTTASTTTAPAAATASKTVKKSHPKASPERTAVSKQCSSLADAKGLHGKSREKFRAECKKNGGKMPG